MDAVFFILFYPLLLIGSLIAGQKRARRVGANRTNWKPLGLEGGLVSFYALLISFVLIQAGNNARERSSYIYDTSDRLASMLRKSKWYEKDLQEDLFHHISSVLTGQLTAVPSSKEAVFNQVKKLEIQGAQFDQRLIDRANENLLNRQEAKELMIDLDRFESAYYRLLHSYHHSAPKLVLCILILFSLLIGFLFGFLRGMLQTKVHISTVIFTVMSCVIIYVIYDLDNPSSGVIRPDFTEIEDLQAIYKSYFESTIQPAGAN